MDVTHLFIPGAAARGTCRAAAGALLHRAAARGTRRAAAGTALHGEGGTLHRGLF